MATAKRVKSSWLGLLVKLLVVLVLAAGLVAFFFGEALAGFGQAGTGYAAKSVCSCRHVAGRGMDSANRTCRPTCGQCG